jgi:hypothetical protein
MDFKIPNILFLKGITIDDIVEIEDLYQKELLDNVNKNYNSLNLTENNIIYDKIPKCFYDIKSWVKNTNVRCWYCSLKFKNTPWFIIKNIYSSSNGACYDVEGNFCSAGCLQGYVEIHFNKRKDFDIYHNIKLLYKLFYNKNINEIIISPSKYSLKIYGGDLDMIDYQKKIFKINQMNINGQ